MASVLLVLLVLPIAFVRPLISHTLLQASLTGLIVAGLIFALTSRLLRGVGRGERALISSVGLLIVPVMLMFGEAGLMEIVAYFPMVYGLYFAIRADRLTQRNRRSADPPALRAAT